jgi:hypothetical protein
MSITLKKIDTLCSNIQLIDSNVCLGDSLPIINQNITALNANLEQLSVHLTEWDNILTSFYPISSIMLNTMYNIQNINKVVPSPYATIQSLSASWGNKQFSVYYPRIYELVGFNGTNAVNNELLYWLKDNFPASSFVEGQIVNVFVNLKYKNVFAFKYEASYQENCSPTQHSADATVSCSGAGGETRSAGCNHVVNGHKVCDNPYQYCTVKKISDTGTYTCQGTIGNTYVWTSVNEPHKANEPHDSGTANGVLNINYIQNGNDTFVARVISYTFKVVNSTWTLI